jgi:hypothetical protein
MRICQQGQDNNDQKARTKQFGHGGKNKNAKEKSKDMKTRAIQYNMGKAARKGQQ